MEKGPFCAQGYLLNGGKDVDASDKTLLSKLRTIRNAILQQSPQAFAFTSAGTAKGVLAVSNATGLPTVALSLPSGLLTLGGGGTDAGHVSAASMSAAASSIQEMVALRDALPHTIDQPGIDTLDEGEKTALFEPFIYKMHYFTKTGSGQA